ncbi:hypothetical protein ACEPAF_6275 [Sanghuangporus sanghuang]
MLIELPQLEYSMDDCEDLFISKMDEDCDGIDVDRYPPSNSKNDDRLTVPHDRGVRGHLSDAEPFYTSSSESDADACFSDIEPLRGMPSRENIHSAMPSSERKTAQKDLALHSPGQLLGTPRDPSRRYEYPFPAHLQTDQSGSDFSDDGSSSSTASTPGLTPGEVSSLGLVALAATLTADLDFVPRYASLRTDLPGSVPAPVPVPVPAPVPPPIAVPNANPTHIVTKGSNIGVSPLSQVPLPGPSSAPALGINPSSNTGTSMNSSASSLIAAHPKLSRFNPANMPVPPGLRGRTRTRKSASVSSVPVSIPPHQGMVASVSIPTSVSSVAAASAAQAAAVSSVVAPTTMVESS